MLSPFIRRFDGVDLGNPPDVPLLANVSRDECPDDRLYLVKRVLPAAKGQYIRSVVLAGIPCEGFGIAGGGADTWDFVCSHRTTDSGPINNDPGVHVPRCNCLRDSVCEIGIVDGI